MNIGKLKSMLLPVDTVRLIERMGGKDVKGYTYRDCFIIANKSVNGLGHFSISHRSRFPTEGEIKRVQNALFPGVYMELIQVNEQNHCVNLCEVVDSQLH